MDPGVKDIIERHPVDDAEPPKPPAQKQPTPLNKKWIPRRRPVVLDPSAGSFQAQAHSQHHHEPVPPPLLKQRPAPTTASTGDLPPLSESERIHLENIRKLQQMSPEEVEREREEIFRSMNPDVLQSLLRRAELKESESAKLTAGSSKPVPTPEASGPTQGSLEQPLGTPVTGVAAPSKGTITDWDPAPSTVNPKVVPTGITDANEDPHPPHHDYHHNEDEHKTGVHFPPTPEELRKYFPDLPVETEKMAWMQPISESEEAEYSTELASVAPSELRFDFKGNLITPRQSRNIEPTKGLHHHGDAPSAAGYTLPELAHLSRSSHPAQRAMAIQTAGRVLHKLRLRKFARSSDLQEGLMALVQTTRIMDSLVEAADESTRSLTVRTLATEALWLANTDNEPKSTESNSEPAEQTSVHNG